MRGSDLEKEILSRCSGLTVTDIRDAISAIPAAFTSPVPSDVINPSAVAISEELSGNGPAGGSPETAVSAFNYPECFRCYIDIQGSYQVESPVVCLPDGSRIEATGADGISGQGSYYCKVTKTTSGSETTYSAEITTEESAGDGEGESSTKTLAVVPLFDIDGHREVFQKHVGAIVITGGSGYEPADHSGLVVNDDNELDLSGREESDEFAVHDVLKKNESGQSESVAKVLSTADVELTAGVESLNGSSGVMHIIGGKRIDVETDKQTIKISYNANKEDEDEDPQKPKKDDCEHPGNSVVSPGGGGSGGGVGGGGIGSRSGGGVIAGGGGTHTGNSDCCGTKTTVQSQ